MNALLVVLTLLVSGGTIFLAPAEGPGALAICAAFALPITIILARRGPERTFLLRLFVIGLLIRLLVGVVIYLGHFEDFFGGDAKTYDMFGVFLNATWHGEGYYTTALVRFMKAGAGAWGMLYLVAGVYELIGRNMLAIQFINAAVGAAAPAVIYYIAQHLFNNVRVSRLAAILTCFFPSLVLWSSQALKDGIIVLVLALAILATLRLMEKVTVRYVAVLTACLLGLLSLRFYIFYMMIAAVVGAFVVGSKSDSVRSLAGRFLAMAVIGLFFTWFGVIHSASKQFERYGNLEAVERSRRDASRRADSGFGQDEDVRTTEGALTAIPMGIIYLLFAPFPWELESLRQSLTLPEMIVWWLSFPLLVLGFWFAIRHRLREVSPILLFTTMLTLVYSVFQGNVGTAYRQRSQLLVFYFIFVAVGAVLLKERSEDRRKQRQLAKQQLTELQAARALGRRTPGRRPAHTVLGL
jgi:4-amino-4-deoxy-L-arabinose transferase-like glycosyltransferase